MTVFPDNIRVPMAIFLHLENCHQGEVLLTTSKGIYLQFSNRILLLAPDRYGATPIGLGLEDFVGFTTAVKPKNGDSVKYENCEFHFPGGVLKPRWNVLQAQPWSGSARPEQVDCCARILVSRCSDKSLALLASPLLLDQEISHVAQKNPYCVHAYPTLVKLLAALSDNDDAQIHSCVESLLGLGIGLTPSMDDVLSGLLYGLMRLNGGEPLAAVLREAIEIHAPTHTNAISAAYLIAAAQGACFDRLDDMLASLATSETINIEPILEIGSSSGSEMLFGLLLATKLTMRG